MSDKDVETLVEEINEWLTRPETHLNKTSRRDILEDIVTSHIGKVKRNERMRAHGRDFIMLAGVLTIIGSQLPRILMFLGVSIQ